MIHYYDFTCSGCSIESGITDHYKHKFLTVRMPQSLGSSCPQNYYLYESALSGCENTLCPFLHMKKESRVRSVVSFSQFIKMLILFEGTHNLISTELSPLVPSKHQTFGIRCWTYKFKETKTCVFVFVSATQSLRI